MRSSLGSSRIANWLRRPPPRRKRIIRLAPRQLIKVIPPRKTWPNLICPKTTGQGRPVCDPSTIIDRTANHADWLLIGVKGQWWLDPCPSARCANRGRHRSRPFLGICSIGPAEKRPGRDDCLKALRRDDALIIWKLDRIGRTRAIRQHEWGLDETRCWARSASK
ncbi:recombinase family protein [Glacieibacterium megasporae]|uniref:recombinase family protein n=1 Tax=Glacieibacterium megasporae TaxID=2835787 RepID=UPI003F7159D8